MDRKPPVPGKGQDARLKQLFNRMSPVNGELLQSLEQITAEGGIEQLEALLPEGMAEGISRIVEQVRTTGSAEVMLDSDGTGFMTIDSEKRALYNGKLFPGDAIVGEPPQEFVRDLRVTQDQVAVWRGLAEQGVTASVFSGRKAGDLSDTYGAALGIDGFALFSAKGRGMVTAEGISLSPELQEKLAEDPLGQVAEQMANTIMDIALEGVDTEESAARRAVMQDLWEAASQGDKESDKELEKQTGYRVSRQYVDGKVVLVRLHHLYRACELGAAAGVQGLDNPKRIDRDGYSEWLQSEDPTAQGILAQMQKEDAAIMAAWNSVLGEDGLASLNLQTTDHVGHRSFCQDQAPVVDITELLTERGVALYAGDNANAGGNDRLAMEALRRVNPDAVAVAVHHGHERAPGTLPEGAVQANQFQLFLAQYALLKRLQSAE